MTPPMRIVRIFGATIAASLAACYSGDYGPNGSDTGLRKVSGDAQTVATEDTSAELVVAVRDQYGDPLPGRVVTWSVAAGPGSVVPTTGVTDEDGTTRTRYVAGPDAGTARIVGRLGPNDSVAFTIRVTGTPAPGEVRILAWFGEGLIAEVSDTSVALQVRVVTDDDRFLGISGAAVSWRVAGGPGQMLVVDDTTDGVGLARARYIATADTGTRVVVVHLAGTRDSALFHLRVLPPCPIGTVTVGQAIDSALVGGACNRGDFDLEVVAGQAYFITYTHRPDPAQGGLDRLDPLLALWKRIAGRSVQFGRDRLLAVSDDEGGSRNSELVFVAPESENLRVQALTFGGQLALGGYRVKVETCPVIPVTADPGTATYTLPAVAAGTCLRHHQGLTSAYRLLSVPVSTGEEVTITVASADFTPVWDAFSNWASFGESGGEVETIVGTDRVRIVKVFEAGLVTIAIGGDTPAASGDFNVTIQREPPGAPLAADPLPR
jgi:Big-like domain-containing protein